MKPITISWDLKTPLSTTHILISSRLMAMVTISEAHCCRAVV